MKKLILVFLAFIISLSAVAQQNPSEAGKLQFGAFGGLSMPLGTYKDSIGRANNGATGGLFIDKYFRGNNFGIGIDARYLQHASRPFDTVSFGNGNLEPTYNNSQTFKHFCRSNL